MDRFIIRSLEVYTEENKTYNKKTGAEVNLKSIFGYSYTVENGIISVYDIKTNNYAEYITKNLIVCKYILEGYGIDARGKIWSYKSNKYMAYKSPNKFCSSGGYQLSKYFITEEFLKKDNIIKIISEIENLEHVDPSEKIPQDFSYSNYNIRLGLYSRHASSCSELEEDIESRLFKKELLKIKEPCAECGTLEKTAKTIDECGKCSNGWDCGTDCTTSKTEYECLNCRNIKCALDTKKWKIESAYQRLKNEFKEEFSRPKIYPVNDYSKLKAKDLIILCNRYGISLQGSRYGKTKPQMIADINAYENKQKKIRDKTIIYIWSLSHLKNRLCVCGCLKVVSKAAVYRNLDCLYNFHKKVRVECY